MANLMFQLLWLLLTPSYFTITSTCLITVGLDIVAIKPWSNSWQLLTYFIDWNIWGHHRYEHKKLLAYLKDANDLLFGWCSYTNTKTTTMNGWYNSRNCMSNKNDTTRCNIFLHGSSKSMLSIFSQTICLTNHHNWNHSIYIKLL